MTQIQAHEIENYLHKVEAGETLIITRAGKPIAQMMPIKSSAIQSPRPFGLCVGEFEVPADFDAPLPNEILDAFEGR